MILIKVKTGPLAVQALAHNPALRGLGKDSMPYHGWFAGKTKFYLISPADNRKSKPPELQRAVQEVVDSPWLKG
jgi:hypothetical protein